MSEPSLKTQPVPDRSLIEALSGLDAQADFALVQRTRRAVMEAAHQMRAGETRTRRQLGIVMLAFLGLVLLLTPAVWMVVDDMFNNGEHFQDTPAMTMSLVITLFSAIFAALIVHLRSRRARDGEES
jgi:cytochrome bd-type quinol oxidase subunit 2